jgi:uncharacterized protein YkwD
MTDTVETPSVPGTLTPSVTTVALISLVLATGVLLLGATAGTGIDAVDGPATEMGAGIAEVAAGAQDSWYRNDSALRAELHESVNDARAERGAPRLQRSASLQAAASAHAADMANRSYYSHTSPGGQTADERLAAAGVACDASETLYRTTATTEATSEAAFADAVVDQWLDSPTHRDVILSPHLASGFGVAVGEYDGEKNVFVVQTLC